MMIGMRGAVVVTVGAVFVSGVAVAQVSLDKTKLPLGDGKYLTQPKKGYVFSCITDFHGGGAFRDGPWIDSAAKTWDLTKKISVQGSVHWSSRFTATPKGTTLRLSGNGLPPHTTGVYPVAASDPAYQYDRNPNSIKSYVLAASLPRYPKVKSKPTCVGGTVGVMKTGIPIYSAFDALGRDAGAHEIQDACEGHPQITGQYHYHSLSPCISDKGSKSSHSSLVGWALDGFAIYGTRGQNGEEMTTAKLDVCHGHTHVITWNGKRVRMYHYHATLDFPYVIGCYRGTPIKHATGLSIGGSG
jgi:YHYH protein